MSLPMRECGLKPVVRPFERHKQKSLPMRECGLKRLSLFLSLIVLVVTPHAGVWIETRNTPLTSLIGIVTPHAGVWIETNLLKLAL